MAIHLRISCDDFDEVIMILVLEVFQYDLFIDDDLLKIFLAECVCCKQFLDGDVGVSILIDHGALSCSLFSTDKEMLDVTDAKASYNLIIELESQVTLTNHVSLHNAEIRSRRTMLELPDEGKYA